MAKLKSEPINEGDLNDFLHTQSDFDFEMRVLSTLRELEFSMFALWNIRGSGYRQDPPVRYSGDADASYAQSGTCG
jgi:hypothetical protein